MGVYLDDCCSSTAIIGNVFFYMNKPAFIGGGRDNRVDVDDDDQADIAKVVDFGIAKIYDPALRTTLGARAITPGYSPPEQYGHGRNIPPSVSVQREPGGMCSCNASSIACERAP